MAGRIQSSAATLARPAERADALRAAALPVAQSALAAAIAWYLAHNVIGHSRAFFAPIAALLALGVGVSNRPRRVVELTAGVAVGILVGDLLVWGIGSGAWQLGLIVFLAMASAVLVGGGPLLVSQAGSSAVLVSTLAGSHNGSRFVDALVGGGVGLAVLVAAPINPLKRAQRAGALVFSELAGALDDVAAAIDARDVALVREALARARATETLVTNWHASLAVGRETAFLSPLYWRDRDRLTRYAAAAEQLELAVRNVRVLARAAIRAVELDPRLPPELAESVRLLATAVREVEQALDSPDPSPAIEAAIQASVVATEALERDPDLTAAHVVGQVRSTTTDLLRTLGLERSEAVDRIRRAAGLA